MFYRKQNYLLLVSIIIAIACSFLLIWKKVDPDNGFTYFLYPWKVFELNDLGEEINFMHFPYAGIGMLGLFNIFLSFYTTIWFRNLHLQKKFCAMLMLVDLTQLVFCFLFAEKISKIWLPYIDGQWGIGVIFILVNALLHLLSFIFIQNDIKLLRSSKHFR